MLQTGIYTFDDKRTNTFPCDCGLIDSPFHLSSYQKIPKQIRMSIRSD